LTRPVRQNEPLTFPDVVGDIDLLHALLVLLAG
jgi:hypothetical protein